MIDLYVCLVGTLARSIHYTFNSIYYSFIENLKDKFNIIIVVIGIDTEETPIDGCVTDYDIAYNFLSARLQDFKIFHIRLKQRILDLKIEANRWKHKLKWLKCHPKIMCPNNEHVPNMFRHLLAEHECGTFLKDKNGLAISISPDIKFDINSEVLVSTLKDLINSENINSLYIPNGSGPQFIVNGFTLGMTLNISKFLLRQRIIFSDSSMNQPMCNWENMCRRCVLSEKLLTQTLNIDMVKIRANGNTKKVWRPNK
jgi:hypothetical protein